MNRPDDIYHKDSVPSLVRRSSHRPHRKKKSPSGTKTRSRGGLDDASARRARPNRAPNGEHMNHFTRRLLISLLCVIVVVYLIFLVLSLNSDAPTAAPSARAEMGLDSGSVSPVSEPDQEDVLRIARLVKSSMQVNQDLLKVYSLLDDGQFKDAQIKLEQSEKLRPNDLSVKKASAEVQAGLRNYEVAKELLFEVLAATPEDIEARLALTRVLVALHRNDAVLTMTDWVLASQPYSIEARHAAAIAALNLDMTSQAVMQLKKIIEIDGQYQPARNLLGVAYRRQGAYDKAIQLLTEQLESDRRDSVVYYNLAICYAARNEPEKSIEWLAQAVDMFGKSFVQAWLKSEEFDIVRTNPVFIAFSRRLKKSS